LTMVRAKFRCTAITQKSKNHGVDGGTRDYDHVVLEPVMDDDNKSWSTWTPGGMINMTISNPTAIGQFKSGECYFVDFTPAPQKESDEGK
jgi:hypothetical protein